MLTNLKEIFSEINKRIKSIKITPTEDASGNAVTEITSGIAINSKNSDGFPTQEGPNNEEAFVPMVGLALIVLICLIAFVWGAHSARRRRDDSYTLKNNSRSHSRQYLTFTNKSGENGESIN